MYLQWPHGDTTILGQVVSGSENASIPISLRL